MLGESFVLQRLAVVPMRLISDRCHMLVFFFFQAEDGIRDLVRSRGLGDVYKRQARLTGHLFVELVAQQPRRQEAGDAVVQVGNDQDLSLIHI